ncbi:MAG: transposase [Verrucomicrobia bacterium]|nr:transposase [Verrucomicrobiota bacterium]MDA1085841.1 transposase [Verrucomicrobiota bacterium]
MNDWPHAPLHRLSDTGSYMVTCGTYRKAHHLRSAERLSLVEESLFAVSNEFGWSVQAWAVLSNHYHFVAASPEESQSLSAMLSKLHSTTARTLNQWDSEAGRKVWYQYFDTRISHQTSYYARLKYVQENPVHHGLVSNAENYRWCSAAWFARNARPSFYRTIQSFKIDRVNVYDEFDAIEVSTENTIQSGVRPPHSRGYAQQSERPS